MLVVVIVPLLVKVCGCLKVITMECCLVQQLECQNGNLHRGFSEILTNVNMKHATILSNIIINLLNWTLITLLNFQLSIYGPSQYKNGLLEKLCKETPIHIKLS